MLILLAAVLPAAAPTRPHMHHCPQQGGTRPGIGVKRRATQNSLDQGTGPCYITIQLDGKWMSYG